MKNLLNRKRWVINGCYAILSITFLFALTVSQPAFAETGYHDGVSTEKLSDGLPPCPDGALAASLRSGPRAYFTIAKDAQDRAASDSIAADARNPMKFERGKLIEIYCLGVYLKYFDLIRLLMTGAAKIEAIITSMLNAVFNYICEAIGTPVKNLFNKLCVPIPDLGFTLEVPVTRSGSCSGDLSMTDLMEVTPGIPLQTAFPIKENFLTAPLSRWLGSDGTNGRF